MKVDWITSYLLVAFFVPALLAPPVQAQTDIDPANVPGVDAASTQKLVLTPAQRDAIYAALSKDKSKVATKPFAAVAGAEVPPMIVLYPLPEDAVVGAPAAKFYQYILVSNQVVLVDPTKMRVIAVIGPPS